MPRTRVTPVSASEADLELAQTLDALDNATNYADWIVSMAAPHLGAHILEVGAGHGTLTERLLRHGKVTATDLSPRCVDALRLRFGDRDDVEVIEGDACAAVGSGRAFDSAVLVNVLEHIEDDNGALRDLRELLVPGGTLVLFVPAFAGLYSDFDRLVGHHRRYRRDDLAAAVTAAGFDVLEARYVNGIGAVAWWVLARQLHQIPTRPWSVTFYDRVATPLVRRLETRWTPPFGQSVLCVGRRR